ncbi:hypothetical protein A33M_1498 [Rhodovulum sp. PH10]|uniref:protein-disulfide reductase DsbD domain-containing protein n=1 Tax=Rhodovulum sp. PH10 TaxID=1187851 RepID=UPI00027C1FC4|nr:protein-disulfide reductase DsbD domain-containing protein [Rhodovulum sp. PH10]EJW12936.1 hypothetical protein A33M_1498 [Rhodovulum sp. PH10]
MNVTMRRCALPVLTMLALTGGAAVAGPTVSAWDGDARGAVRLIGGGATADAPSTVAGVEIRLGDGWKTYWRYPGDSGVPPRFDFSRSVNVKSATVRYPAPHRFADGGGTSIGYKGGVIFPVAVARDDATQAATLAVEVDYAVCERLCVPKTGTATLVLPAESAAAPTAPATGAMSPATNGSSLGGLAGAVARLPRPARVGDAGDFSVRAVHREGEWPTPRLVVDVAAPAGTEVDLFAEGPTAAWALPVPNPAGSGPDGTHRFTFEVDGAPAGVDPRGATLTLTAVAGDRAIAVPVTLDP